MFPFLTGQREVRVNRIDLFFEATGAERSAHRLVEFFAPVDGHTTGKLDRCDIREIDCVASAEWPGLYHGVLDVELGPVSGSREHDMGLFCFATCPGDVSRAFVLCHYETRESADAAAQHRSPDPAITITSSRWELNRGNGQPTEPTTARCANGQTGMSRLPNHATEHHVGSGMA